MKHYTRFVALTLVGVLLLACAACGEGKVTMRPAVMYQGDLYMDSGRLSDKDLEGEDMSYVGEITSLVPSYELPKEDWQGNNESQLNAKVYLSDDGTMHLLLTNGRQIEMKRHATNAPVTTDTPDDYVQNGPFAAARRIYTRNDLRYDSDGKPIIEEGEVLVRFHYMDTFDTDAWQVSTIIQVAWAIEAVNHAASLGDTGQALRKSEDDNGEHFFTHWENYDFGAAFSETWMLPEEGYTAAFNALLSAAKEAGEKDFWLIPNNYSGVLSPVYDTATSFRINSYLPEQLRPNAEPIYMSTGLMREHFPFLREPGVIG